MENGGDALKPDDPTSGGGGEARSDAAAVGERRKSESASPAAQDSVLPPSLPNRVVGESKSQDSALGGAVRSGGRVAGPTGGLSVPFASPDYPSLSSTPNSISQLLTNLPSSAFTLDGLEYPSPLGSGIISPLTAGSGQKLGHKRPISISPLSSTSQLELNSLMRSSPSSLINCMTSRGDSANSISHLSPSLTTPINPSLFASPHKAPLFSLRNAAHPPPLNITASFPLGGATTSAGPSPEHLRRTRDNRFPIKQEPLDESGSSQQRGNDPLLQFNTNSQESGFNSQPRELETLPEEDDILSDDEMQTDPSNSDCSSRYTGEGESQDSKHGILDRKPRRVSHSWCPYLLRDGILLLLISESSRI